MIWNNHHQITKLVVKNYEGGRNFFTPIAHVGLGTAPTITTFLQLLEQP